MENENVKQTEEREVGVSNTLPATSARDSDVTSLMSATDDFQYIEKLSQQMENLQKIGEVFVKGTLCAAKTIPDFVVATITGQQLKLPMMTSVNNIINISGKSALATHLMRALILRAGITYEKVCDFTPMYVYYEGEKDPDNPGQLRAKKIKANAEDLKGTPIPRGMGTLEDMDDTKFVAGRAEVDRVTKYVFTRMLRQSDGSYKEMKVTSYFTMGDASKAGLLDKDNYQKYPARMLDARAFAIGAREIGSDVLFGMYTIAEIADANGVSYAMSESFNEEVEDVDAEFIR